MGASFATIFPSIPAMLRKDPTGNYDLLDSAPVASLGLADGYTMDAQTGAFAGEYEDFGSALVGACTGGLQNGCPVEGQLYDDGSFDASRRVEAFELTIVQLGLELGDLGVHAVDLVGDMLEEHIDFVDVVASAVDREALIVDFSRGDSHL